MPWTADDIPVAGRQDVRHHRRQQRHRLRGGAAARRQGRAGRAGVSRSGQGAQLRSTRSSAAHRSASVALMELDLADLKSIRRFADAVRAAHPALHVLCNNAGVMAIPYRRTADGFEMQFGTNHLGHFALTGLLLEPPARDAGRARGHGQQQRAQVRRDALGRPAVGARLPQVVRLRPEQARQPAVHLRAAAPPRRPPAPATISVACHPGYAATNLQAAGPRMQGSSIGEAVMELANRVFAQSAAMGALPTLYAATAPDVRGGDYIGPDGLGEQWGHPKKVRSIARAQRPRGAAAPVGDLRAAHRRALRRAALTTPCAGAAPSVARRRRAAVVVIVAIVVALGRLDAIVEREIEARGSAMTQTAVRGRIGRRLAAQRHRDGARPHRRQPARLHRAVRLRARRDHRASRGRQRRLRSAGDQGDPHRGAARHLRARRRTARSNVEVFATRRRGRGAATATRTAARRRRASPSDGVAGAGADASSGG